ncbi:purine-cytosine permease family protein [Oryzihumus sp.]|jgi:NCS1 nucleoside transporter family|uniref:purine-cytosine permease family protein n=1 Tax=Oryzihumus sp. TaxID=1968903 RepID=UPI002EDA0847
MASHSTSGAAETAERRPAFEVRSIDYVPLNERHGKLWHLGPLWFMSNAQIATLAVGVLGVTTGGNLIWSLIAIVLGVLTGTFFMAAHSAQGPQLGLPQMIQSRPQFGYVGAILVWLFAYLQYAGFNVFNTLLAADSAHATVHGGTSVWIVVATIVAAVAAIAGYDFIHKMERWLAYGFVVLFGILTIAFFTFGFPAGSFDLGHFDLAPFLLQYSVVAGYQISWAIYVSDYSRYLPPDVTVSKTFWWTYGGSGLGAIWIMSLGAALAAWAGKAFDAIPSLESAGNQVFDGFGAVILVFSALGLISVTALNMYGGSLTLISASDSFKRIRPTLGARIVTISLTAAISLVGALASTKSFQTNFENFLLLVLYLFIPWTAVNLVDYFIVRHGHYAIEEIFNPTGMYGRWGWRGIAAYLIGFAAMVPFFSTGLYTGPVAEAAKGADFSLFVGLPVSAVLYWLFCRNLDIEAEVAVATKEREELEYEAVHHMRPEPGHGPHPG